MPDNVPMIQAMSVVQRVPRYSIGKIRISAVTMDRALEAIDVQVHKVKAVYICVTNIRTTVLAQKDAEFCRIQNDSFLTVPDGMPLTWIAKVAGIRGIERVAGYHLMMEIFAASADRGYSHYFLGDTEVTLAKLNRIVRDRYPGINIRGSYSPPFKDLSDSEVSCIAARINEAAPTFVWVALGAPKQELFMARLVGSLQGAILVGVGAAFRLMIGEYRCAPRWAQVCGLEGVFWRFLKNPLREAWWYCRHIPPLLWFLVGALCKRIQGVRNG